MADMVARDATRGLCCVCSKDEWVEVTWRDCMFKLRNVYLRNCILAVYRDPYRIHEGVDVNNEKM